MPETITTSVPSFHSDTYNLFPLEEYDTLQGVYENVKYSVKYTPCDHEKLVSVRGNYTIRVFSPDSDPLSEGGVVWYTEKHKGSGTDEKLVMNLFQRAKEVAVEITNREDLVECPYCGFLTSTDNRVISSLSLRKGIGRAINSESEDDCIGLHSWILPKAEVYKHSEENLFFSTHELDSCESLVRTVGYPSWARDVKLSDHDMFRIRELLEQEPDVFREELDVETIEAVFEWLDGSRSSNPLIDYLNLSERDE